MTVETEDYTQLVTDIQEQVVALGGYIEQFESYNENSIGGRSANLTLRIPADQLDSFVTRVDEVSNVISRQESVEDVTLQYVDLESHRKMRVVSLAPPSVTVVTTNCVLIRTTMNITGSLPESMRKIQLTH